MGAAVGDAQERVVHIEWEVIFLEFQGNRRVVLTGRWGNRGRSQKR